ncbi:hypothetical protein [Rubneribacter badeniensis]|uniref:hypothetical protein n=1 Tax=Rubneribacter badeniensis TaxID=2070688 RepID=UPI003A90025B
MGIANLATRYKRYLGCAFLTGCLSVSLWGCASTDSAQDNGAQTASSALAVDAGQGATVGDAAIPLENALSGSGLFILNGSDAIPNYYGMEEVVYCNDTVYPDLTWTTWDGADNGPIVENLLDGSGKSCHVVKAVGCGTSPYYTLNKDQNEQLIVIGNEAISSKLYRVDKDGYYADVSPYISSPLETGYEYPVGGLSFDGQDVDIVEINGVDVTNPGRVEGSSPGSVAALNALKTAGIKYEFIGTLPNEKAFLLTSEDAGKSVTIGYYAGSRFGESEIPLDEYYYVATELETAIEHTKDGYFVIDTSALEPGLYLASMPLGTDNAVWYPFEIV